MLTTGYAPIEDYGVIGDLHTVALVGKNGCRAVYDRPRSRMTDCERS